MTACAQCKRPIVKNQMATRVEERVHTDGSPRWYADGTSDLPDLKKATGRLKAVYHFRCYFQMRKHTGKDYFKYLDSSPTAYEEAAQYKNRDDLVVERQDRLTRAKARLEELQSRRSAVQTLDEVESGAVETHADEVLLSLDALIAEAEQETVLAARQVAIAEEQAKEETIKGESDWRDPTTLDI